MSRYAMCPVCGHRMHKLDEETYICPWCADSDDEDDMPEGCAACGGPYPNCKDSCPIFDD